MIEIVLANGNRLDYESEEGLGIKLNRIVDDFNQPDRRFGEFSFSFSLPRTKNNDKVWEWPDVKGRTRIFRGKQFDCLFYQDSKLLLDGVIELTSVESDSYKAVFFSKFTQLSDSLKSKKLVDITSLPTITWNYEKTIATHINANYTPDQTDYQFPFTFYKTPFISGYTFQDGVGQITTPEAAIGYVYNYLDSSVPYGKKNPVYYRNFPPAIYLRSILKAMLNEAGWNLNGTFFERQDIKKIVILFTGDSEDFSGAIISGVTHTFNMNRVLPDMGQIDFLRSVVNAFNLYFIVDNENKSITFEPYNVLFASTDNAYEISSKIDLDSIVKLKPEAESKIVFEKDSGNNELVCGYNRGLDYYITNPTLRANPTYWLTPNNEVRLTFTTVNHLIRTTYKKGTFERLWNKQSGEKEIKLAFSPVNYFPYTIYNERTTDNTTNTSSFVDGFTVGIPLVTEQTPSDHKGNLFAEESENYCEGNAPSRMKYDGGLKMAYYYGRALYNLTVGTSTYRNFSWIGIATGGTCTVPTFARVRVPIASPYQLLTVGQVTELKTRLELGTSNNYDERFSEVGAENHNLLLTYYTAGSVDDIHTPTHFSLTMGTNPDNFGDNLYSYFHEQKYETLRNGHLLKATMRMDSNDWNAMQIYVPILYDKEIYQLVSIKNYDVTKNSAEITILKRS